MQQRSGRRGGATPRAREINRKIQADLPGRRRPLLRDRPPGETGGATRRPANQQGFARAQRERIASGPEPDARHSALQTCGGSERHRLNSFKCHETPTGVKTQWRATCCRNAPGKSLHCKDLRPNRQHPDEQRKRRQRGSFFDYGPNHDPPSLTGQNGNGVLFLFRSQERVVGQFQLWRGKLGMINADSPCRAMIAAVVRGSSWIPNSSRTFGRWP
jgi:hypothetical protein